MKKIAALAVICGIWFIPVSSQGEGAYKGKLWREQGNVPQGVPVPVETAHPRVKVGEAKTVSIPCQEKVTPAKPALKPKKARKRHADLCLKEIRRNFSVIRKLERELGTAKERERFNQEWFRNYREWYKKFGDWQVKPKSWL